VSDIGSKRDLEKYLETYESLPFEVIQEHFRRKSLIEFLARSTFRIATEIGCGRSSLYEHWLPSERAQTFEPIPTLLNDTKEKMFGNSIWSGFESRVEDAFNLEGLHPSDVTIVSSLLHEVEDPQKLLSSIKEITSPGGMIIVIVTNKYSLHRILGVHLGLLSSLDEKTKTEFHLQQSHGAYSREELVDEIESADLEVIEVKTIFPKLFSHRQMSDLLERTVISFEFLETMSALAPELSEFGSELFVVARRKDD